MSASDEAGTHRKIEVWREGVTMALYISLSQLAVMTALPGQQSSSDRGLALVVALTSIGLILAHQVAFRMSSKLFAQGSRLGELDFQLLRSQTIGGGAVTVVAVLPILLFGAGAYVVSILLLLLFVMVVGYLVARTVPLSRLRSLVYVVGVAVVVIGVLAVKSLVGH
jgi:hypothetical protein